MLTDLLEVPIAEIGLLDPMRILKADLREAAGTLGIREVRYLVDLYYQVQEVRKASGNQQRQMGDGEPHKILDWVHIRMQDIEGTIKGALDSYTMAESTGMGAWAREFVGIGPVLSAGLLAHIEIEKAPTIGHIWRFAGLDPSDPWEKGQKRPWNADLKVICYKIGDSFKKFHNHPNDTYGKFYVERKAYEVLRNDRFEYRDQAEAKLRRFVIGKATEAYKAYSIGKLPPAHIDQRAQRWATKLFLAHWFKEAYRRHWGKEPPLPYPIAILGHTHLR